MKLWFNASQVIETNKENAGDNLTAEIAVRSRSVDWMGVFGYLPDPDEVLRKLGQDMTVYKQLLTDAHVWSCFESRKSGTLSCEFEIREGSEGGVRVNKRAFQIIDELMKDLDVESIISDILNAPFFGMSPIEVVWKAIGDKWLPAKIEGKPPEWFRFSTKNELRFLSKENQLEGEELPPRRFLLPRSHATYQNPYGERALSRCFWPVAFKKGGFKFWAIFTEKYGMPWVIGRVPRSTNATDRAALLANLASMVQDAVAVINDDERVEIVETKGKEGSAGVYERLISSANREISKAILGQTLSTELDKGGSLAATKGHLEVREDLVDRDKRLVKQTFNRLFQWIKELNFMDAVAPEFAFFEEEDIQKDRAERDGLLTKQGVRLSEDYYRRTYNLEEGDFVLGEPQPSGPGPGQGPENPAFAEKRADNQFSQEDTIQVSQEGTKAAQKAIQGLLEPILKDIAGVGTYEEIGEIIYKRYPHLDDSRFQDLLARAMFTCALGGAAGEIHEHEGDES